MKALRTLATLPSFVRGLGVGLVLWTISGCSLPESEGALADDARVAIGSQSQELSPTPGASSTAGAGGGNVTSRTVTKPAGVTAGTLLITSLLVSDLNENGDVTITGVPSGFTELQVAGSPIRTWIEGESNPYPAYLTVYWKIATGSEPASYTWTFSESREHLVGMLAVDGARPTNPFDVAAVRKNFTDSSNITFSSVTTTVPETTLLLVGGMTIGVTMTPPSGFTERVDIRSGDLDEDRTLWMGTKAQAATGATGTFAASAQAAGGDGNADDSVGFTIAIAPNESPTQLAFTTSSRTFTAGACGGAGQVITVQLRNSSGVATNAGAGGQAFTASSTGTETWFTDASCTVVATGGTFTVPSGASSVNLYYRDTLAGTPTVSLSNASGLTNPGNQTHTVNVGAAAQLAFITQPSSTTSGAALSPAVRVAVQDSSGNTVTSATDSVTLTIANNPGGSLLSGTTTQAAVSGVATFSNLSLNKVGTGYTLSASATSRTGATSTGFNIAVGAASRLAFSVQPASAQAGATLAPSVQVTVQDSGGNTVTSATDTVTIAIANNPGTSTLSGTLGRAAVSGVATFNNLSLNRVGTGYTLSASAPSRTGATSSAFDITVGAAAQLAFSVQPSDAQAGASLSPSIQVRVQDSSGNTVTSATDSVTLSVGTNPGGATLSGTLTQAAVAGVATFTNVSLNRVGTGYTLLAAAPSRSGTSSTAFNISAGAATRLAFSVQPSNAQAVASLSPSVQVSVQDANGNTVPGATDTITLAIGSNPGGSTLSGTLSRAAVSGVATFSNLSLEKSGTGYTLTAAAPSRTGATSSAFDITAGAPTRVVFIVQPPSGTAGTALSPSVRVAVQDANANTVTSATDSITLALASNPGASTLSGTLTQVAVSGVATFSNVSLNRVGSGYTLAASAPSRTGATSNTFNVAAGTASQLAFTVQPTNTTAAASINPSVRVTVQDSSGNTVTVATDNVTLSVANNPGGSALSGTLTQAAVAGVATFSNVSLNRSGTGYTLAAAAPSRSGATSAGFDIAAGAATQLAFTVQPSNAAANVPNSPSIQVSVQDVNGNLVTGATDSVTLALLANPGGSVLSGTLTQAAVAGVATFSTLALDRTGIGYTLSASAPSRTGTTSDTFDITAGGAVRVAFITQPTSAVAGAAISPSVRVELQDSGGNVVPGATDTVTIAIGTNAGGSSLSGTVSQAAVAGVATFNNLRLNRVGSGYTLTASAPSRTGATSSTFNITPGAASQLAFSAQPASATAGTALPSVQVAVQDANGNTVTSATDTVTVAIGTNPGASVLSGTLSRAAVAGVASFTNLSLDKSGVGYTLTAAAPSRTGAVSTAFNITAGAASRLAFTVQPTTATAAAALSPAIRVAVQDAFGNTVGGATDSITLSLAANPGASTLSGTLTQTAVAGVATFSNVSLNRVGTAYSLSASAASRTGATSSTFDIVVGAAARLSFTVSPTSSSSATAIAPAIQVAIEDASGNRVTSASDTVTLAIANNPGSSTLSGTLTAAASAGVATFSDVSLNRTGVGYTLSAAAPSRTGATSAAFSITAGAPSRLAFTVQPSSAQASAALSPSVRVVVQDAAGNTVTTAADTVTLALASNPGGSTLSGNASVAAVSGVATFANVSLNRTGTGYTLAASAPSRTGTTSNAFNITPGAATRLAFTVQPTSEVAGVTLSPSVEVRVQDSAGNTVPSATDTITLAFDANPGAGSLSGTLARAAVAGVATFNNLSVARAGDGYTLAASAPSRISDVSAAFDILPGAPAQLGFLVQPGAGLTGAPLSPAIRVAVRDNLGNVIPGAGNGISVALGSNPGGSTLSGGTTVGAVSGVSTFSSLSLNRPGVGYTFVASASGFADTTSSAFTVVTSPASQLRVTTNASTVVAGDTLDVTVEALDAFGNRVTDYQGQVAFRSSDLGAQLPATTAVQLTDAGIRTWADGVRFTRAGSQTLSAAHAGAGSVSDGSTSITVLAGQGSGCISNDQCGTGFCADGVCCDSACDGNICEGCNVPGSVGTCGALPNGTACSDAAFCNGEETCQSGSCRDGTDVTCDGTNSFDVFACNEVLPGCAPVANSAPVLLRNALLTAGVGIPYVLNANGTLSARGARPMTFRVCGGPSSFEVDPLSGAVAWLPAAAGPEILCVEAANAHGTDQYTFTVGVSVPTGNAPEAVYSVTPEEGNALLLVSFDGRGSRADPSTGIAAHHWSFQTGAAKAEGSTAEYRYRVPGVHQTSLRVVDGFGRLGAASRDVTVFGNNGQRPPRARITASALEGVDSLTVDFGCDCSQGTAPIAAHLWDFGDGVFVLGESQQRTFGPGRYRVRLHVVDDEGYTATDWTEVVVAREGRLPPTCAVWASSTQLTAPSTVVLSSRFAAASGSTILSHVWNLWDGSSDSAPEIQRAVADAGGYAATFVVTDDTGLTCRDGVTLTAFAGPGRPGEMEEVPVSLLYVPDLSGECGQTADALVPQRAIASGTGPKTWSLEPVPGGGVPEGLTVDAATGELRYQATRHDVSGTVLLRVSSSGSSDAREVSVAVQCGDANALRLGCGCQSGGGAGAALWVLIAALRRRRPREGSTAADTSR